MCRPTVGWLIPSSRAAPDNEPLATTAEKLRHKAQSGSLFMIEYQALDFTQFRYVIE